jgi:hypothetical protein
MMSFRGFQWFYDVTETDEQTRARAASFARRVHQAGRERVNAHRRVTRRQSRTPSERVVSIRGADAVSIGVALAHSFKTLLVTAFGNSAGSPDPELPDPHSALRAQKGSQ